MTPFSLVGPDFMSLKHNPLHLNLFETKKLERGKAGDSEKTSQFLSGLKFRPKYLTHEIYIRSQSFSPRDFSVCHIDKRDLLICHSDKRDVLRKCAWMRKTNNVKTKFDIQVPSLVIYFAQILLVVTLSRLWVNPSLFWPATHDCSQYTKNKFAQNAAKTKQFICLHSQLGHH